MTYSRNKGRKQHNGVEYRSGLEARIAKQLTDAKVPFKFEESKLQYFLKVRKGSCEDCGSTLVLQEHWYTPDFELTDSGIIVETKGLFSSKDRTKMRAVKAQHPELDIRMLFYSNGKLNKGKPLKYEDWCQKYGFKYAFKTLPLDWMKT